MKESVVRFMASTKNKGKQKVTTVKKLRKELDALQKELNAAKARNEQLTELNRQMEELLKERFGELEERGEQIRNLETSLKSSDRQLVSLTRMLACVEFLSAYFGHVSVIEIQNTEQFGTVLSLEAGGLAFDMFQPKVGDIELMIYSAESTEIKLVCVGLPLDSNGQIGSEALGAIKLREEAITPEGRKKLLGLGLKTFGKLYQDLDNTRRVRRGDRLADRCMRHVAQAAPAEQQSSNPKGRLRLNNPHMSSAAGTTLRALRDNNVTMLSPERLDRFLETFDESDPSSIAPLNRKKSPSLTRFFEALSADPDCRLIQLNLKLREVVDPILSVRTAENNHGVDSATASKVYELRDYRDENSTDQ